MRLGENKKKSPRKKAKNESNSEHLAKAEEEILQENNTDPSNTDDSLKVNKSDKSVEKRVSFEDSMVEDKIVEENKEEILGNKLKGCEDSDDSPEVHFAREETAPVELCDIEPLSGTVFRKVTVRRRRQDIRKIPAVDTGE